MTRSTSVSISVTVNGKRERLEVPARWRLVDLLRASLALTGTKVGCDVGECGACTVLMNGVPTLACLVLAAEADGRAVTTIENTEDTRLRALRSAFVEEAGLQCGFCTPGMILAASRLERGAGDIAIREALVGNLCRCTGYAKIVAAVKRALDKVHDGEKA